MTYRKIVMLTIGAILASHGAALLIAFLMAASKVIKVDSLFFTKSSFWHTMRYDTLSAKWFITITIIAFVVFSLFLFICNKKIKERELK